MTVPGSDSPPAGLGPSTVEELLQRFPADVPPIGTAGAAVTIVLRDGDHEVEVLLIERTERLTDPASGQVGLPGGHVDDGDGSLVRTALRELREEVGLGETDLAGELRYVETKHAERFGLNVAVFAGCLAPRGLAPTPSSQDEVATVFWLPRSALNTTVRVHRETPLGLLEVPATVYAGHILWGFTRRVLRDFCGLPPEDPSMGPAFIPRTRETPPSSETGTPE